MTLMKRYTIDTSSPEQIGEIRSNFNFRDHPEMHDHEHWECFILLDGEIDQTINGIQTHLKRGDAYLIRPADVHNLVQTTEDMTDLNIIISSELMEKAIVNFSSKLLTLLSNEEYIHFSLNDLQMSKFQEYTSLLKENELIGDDRELINSVILSQLLNIIIEQRSLIVNDKPKWLMKLIDEINNHENIHWTVKDVLNCASYSHSHLTRKFKKILGCTIVEYLTKVKIAAAIEYLIHSEKSISEIST